MRRAGGLAEPPPRPCRISHLLPPPPPRTPPPPRIKPRRPPRRGQEEAEGGVYSSGTMGTAAAPGRHSLPIVKYRGGSRGAAPRVPVPPPRTRAAAARPQHGRSGGAPAPARGRRLGSARRSPAASATPLPPPAGRPQARTVLVATVAAAALRLRVVPVGGAAALGAVGGCPALTPQELRALLHHARHARAGSGGERRQRWLPRGGS